jgi:DNA polymerase-3 subunit epsilon
MLVTAGAIDGGKAAKARELGTRTVHPDQYAVLLQHLQPALSRAIKAIPKSRPQPAPKHAAGTDFAAADGPPAPGDVISKAPGPNPALARQWARENGFEVGVRGRSHKDVLDAYIAAHPDGA